jgi:type VI secretion system secreted protein VgrG
MQKTRYIWKADGGENMCDLCAALDGTKYESLEDTPELPHPNCKCMIKSLLTGNLIKPHPWTGKYAPKTKYGDSIYIKPDGTRSVHPAWDSPFNREHFSPNGMARLAEWNKAVEKDKIMNMQLSENGIGFLKEKENKIVDKDGKHIVYDDATMRAVPYGQPLPKGATIGYGHLIKKGEDFSKGLTEQQAIDLYKKDMQTAENIVKRYVNVSLSQNQYDALVILAYNIGSGQFRDSTILKYVNNPKFTNPKYPTPESAWKAFNKDINPKTGKLEISRGLVNRRNAEWEIYVNGIY